MELNELVEIWQGSDAQLESNLNINKKLLKEVSISKIKSYLVESKLSNIIEIIVNFVGVLLLMGFVVDYFLDFKYSIPAIILLIIIYASLVFGIYKLTLYYRINVDSSIVQTQKNIERLKFYEILDRNLLYIIIPVFSTAFLIVAAKALLDIDLYQFGGLWMISYTGGSFVVALIVVFALKKFPNRNLQKAIDFLKEVKDMENDK